MPYCNYDNSYCWIDLSENKTYMKPTKILFERVYKVAEYQNERIALEIQLDDTDDIQAAIDYARNEVFENHKKNNPHLDYAQNHQWNKPIQQPMSYEEATKIVEELSTPIDTSFNLIDEINKCKKPLLLKVYEPMAKTPEEKKAYNSKLKELSK